MNYQLNSVEGLDTGSNYKFGDKMLRSKLPRSLFDLSHLNTLTIPNAGMLVPIALWETLPQDDFDINVDCLLRVMPQVVPLYSRQRLFIYGFYSRYSDLWCNWQVFKDKGYTGTDNRVIPYLKMTGSAATSNVDENNSVMNSLIVCPNDLFDYMGLPLGMSFNDSMNSANTGHQAYISALPFMMYLRIYRDYFMNKNHWINDRVMLPEDDSRFRLNDDGLLMSALDQNKHFKFVNTAYLSGRYDLVTNNAVTEYYFSGAMHDYPDDYFVSALPFPQRGNASVLNPPIDTSQLALDFTNAVAPTNLATSTDYVLGISTTGSPGNVNNLDTLNTSLSVDSSGRNTLLTLMNMGKVTGTNISLNITLNAIRKMAIEQQELEQLARTDGSYLQFGLSFFGEASKAAYDFKPTYIGGTYKNIAFTEVLQTATTQTTQSGATVDNSTGSMYGHGITGISNGRIGHIHCDDYGMIMLIACIMPDVYYSQGLERIFTDRKEAEKWMPERVLLGMQPIYNKEIYYAGNNGNSSGDDNYLWAYQNPFDYLRYIPNHIHGKIADKSNKSFYPYTQARHFTQLPNWGRAFSSTSDVRKDYLVAKNEDAYTAQFNMNIRAVRPLPYKATPAKLVHF